jgi:hypothetical protein
LGFSRIIAFSVQRLEILDYTQVSRKKIGQICSILIKNIADPTRNETQKFVRQFRKHKSPTKYLEEDIKGLSVWIKFRNGKPTFPFLFPQMAHLMETSKVAKKRSGTRKA